MRMKNQKKLVIIVIPIYQPVFNPSENISIVQTRKVFSDYPVCFICPTGLKTSEQYKDIPKIFFDRKWFRDVRTYSSLMLQPFLYEAFCDYEYILICQTDAFVFRDELEEFCHFGYDYIGAPWIHGLPYYINAANILHYVGNGGLSLRKVNSFLAWLGQTDLSVVSDHINEDILISVYGRDILSISPQEIALRFAFDMDPRECFRRNGSMLPMGCHAWARIDMEFWRSYIEAEGYDTSMIPSSIKLRHYEKRYLAEEKQKKCLERLGARRRVSDLINDLTRKGMRRLYVWGTGVWGEFVGRIFIEYHFEIEAFIDIRKKSENFLGIQVLHKMSDVDEDACFFIAVENHSEILDQLNERGFRHCIDYLSLEDVINEKI